MRSMHVRLFSVVLATALAGVTPAAAAPPAGFDTRAEALLQASGTPGMGVAIVERGETTLLKGYGVRRLGQTASVDADTIFPIASVSKAFTSTALAILVDQGKIGWDDKVIDHLPDFEMYDPWVAREITVRDLLVHRSGLGLGAGDLLFWPRSSLTRPETVRRLRYLRPSTSFRSGYAYDNVLYIVAGELIEAVSGQTWETFVRDQILQPAGMRTATTEPADRFKNPDRATPHARLNGPIRGLGDQEALDEKDILSVNAAPAGGLTASAADMSRWLQVQLAQGALNAGPDRLFSAAAAREMWTPQTLMPRDEKGAPSGAVPLFSTYALGWKVIDYKGRKIVWHSGGIMGFRALVVLVPELNTGFSVMINSEDSGLIMGLMYELLDHYIDPAAPAKDWPAAWSELRAAKSENALKALVRTAPDKSKPPLKLADYAGEYADPWYGPISIKLNGRRLAIDFRQTPGMTGALEPWSRDTFRTAWDDKNIEPAFVTFAFDAGGNVERIRLRAASPLADFSYDYQDLEFTPVAQRR
jgi:CubicO group peptidase (beta-lactamase class C family)